MEKAARGHEGAAGRAPAGFAMAEPDPKRRADRLETHCTAQATSATSMAAFLERVR